MIIEITPLDTLFFRDGKPFSMGEETWADAIFPPYPSTIYGALRAAWFSENINEFETLSPNDFNQKKDPTKKLKIKNIILKTDYDFLLPMPRDILQNKKQELMRLKISNNNHISSAENIKLLINQSREIFYYEPSWISELDLIDYLKNKISNLENTQKNLFKFEPKIGIARDKISHSSKEGNLYRVGMLRLKEDVRIYVDFEGIEINGKYFKLGGEGKFVTFQKNERTPNIPIPEITNNKFLLYLSTPAIFEKGWIPKWIDENSLEGTIPNTNVKVKLITAAIGRPELIGGFDMAKKEPKPMYKAVPEGSVYYFKILSSNSNKEELIKIHGKPLSDIYPKQGFGICYVGII